MNSRSVTGTVFLLIGLTAIFGCTLPWMAGGTDAAPTMVAATVSALQTQMVISLTETAQAAPVLPSAVIEVPTIAITPLATEVPKNPVVQTTTLCWTGPGDAYPVVSGIKAGTEVIVLGVGSKTGWLVIENPTYHDRCWIEAANLTLDPNWSTAGLQVFNPPPTPGPKITPVPTPTP